MSNFRIRNWNNEPIENITLTKFSLDNILEIKNDNDIIFTQWDIILDWDVFTIRAWTGSIWIKVPVLEENMWATIDWVEYNITNNVNSSLWTYTID